MVVSMDQIKALREETSAGIMDCKRALEESNGDIEAAKVWLQKKGLASAAKKGDREAKQGLIFQFVHEGTIGVLVEVNCETDFVARTDQFVTLGEDIARHIAETGPQYVRPEDIPAEKRASEDSIHGGLDAEVDIKLALLSQPYVGNNKLTVGEMVQSAIGKLGENIVVRRFTRYELEDGEPGLISQYVHNGRIGALLELATDSPEHVRTEVLADLARTVGQHIVGAGPRYINAADMPADEREREREVHDGNDAEVDKELVLLAQPTLRDPRITVGQVISRAAETLGGKITVRRFVRYELGESLGGERPAEALAE